MVWARAPTSHWSLEGPAVLHQDGRAFSCVGAHAIDGWKGRWLPNRSADASADLQHVEVVLAHRSGRSGRDQLPDPREQPLPLMRGGGDVPRVRRQHRQVLLGGVLPAPQVTVHGRLAEEPTAGDRLDVRGGNRLRRWGAALPVAHADLVVDLLDLSEEVIP